MPADYQRLSRLLSLSAGNRQITDVGSSATDFLSDGGLILASDLDIRGGDIQSTTGALTVTTGSGNLIFNPAGVITASKAVHSIDGTASAPALTFTGDTNTGLYRSAADTLDVSLGGTRRLGYSAGVFQFKESTTLSSTGTLTLGSFQSTGATLTNVDINSGAIDGVTIGTNSAVTELRVDHLTLNGSNITSTLTDGSIAIIPNGTGNVNLDADTVRIGDSNTLALLTTDGTGSLKLNTNSGTSSGHIQINSGANGSIDITPDGSGDVNITNVDIDSGDIATAVVINKSPTITLTGDVTASATAMTNLGNVSIATTIAANAIALGTDTTGDYVSTVTAGTGLTSSGATSGENIAHSLSVDASQGQITTVGALNAGSITSGFTSIDVGSGAISSTGTVTTGALVIGGDISTAAAQDWDLLDNNASALSFDATGKAGILAFVTTNSGEKVTMSGGLDVSGTATLATVDINAGAIDGVTIGTNAVVTDLRVDNLQLNGNTFASTDTNGNIVLDPNGAGIISIPNPAKVGIGTTVADGLLHLDNGTVNTYMVLEKDADTAAGFLFHEAGNEKASIVYGADQHLLIKHDESDMDIIFTVNDGGSSTEMMRIDADVARVGIGTATPSDLLHVKGTGTTSTLIESTGASGSGRVELRNDQGANSFGRVETFGASASGNLFGITKANRTYVYAGGSASTGLSLGTETDDIITVAQNNAEVLRIDTSENFGFNVSTFGTNAVKVLGIGAGTAPTSSVADMVQMWVADQAGGDARLFLRTESGGTNNLSFGNGEVRSASGSLTLNANGGSGAITLTGTIAGSAVKDEDDMASDSATHLVTQQSLKAFVNQQVTSGHSHTSLTGVTALDMTAGNKTIFATIGANTLTLGASGTTIKIAGHLQVAGSTTTVSSTTVTIADPIFNLGGNSAPSSDDNLDRGISFRWHNGSAAKVGFFGYDDSAGKMTFIPDATINSEVVSGTAGTIVATTFEGNLTGNVTGNTSGTAATWATARTLSFTGDVTGSGSVDGSANVATALTIAANAVENGMVNVNVVTALTELTSGVQTTADFLLLYDNDDTSFKKVKPANLGLPNASGAAGSLQFSDGSDGFSADASNLHWDDSNNRLGIGTNSPTTTLQVNGVATFESYLDFNLISAPSSPATEDARMYLKQVDVNNNAIAVKIQKAGSIVEVEITSPGAICAECGSEDGTRDPIYDFKRGKMVLNLFCGHSYEVDIPQWRRLV